MNSQSHRLIFNPSRGCLMAVAETSRSCGKFGATRRTRTRRTRYRRGADIQASNLSLAQLAIGQAATNSIAIASNLGAKNITITSGKDLGVKGSNVTADQDVTLSAANNVTIDAATNTQTSTRYSALSESGLMNSGDMSATIGTRDKSTDTKSSSSQAVASTVGSVGGNVNITAGKTYTQRGSDIVAAGNTVGTGNVAITAKKLDIVEAREAFTTSTEQKMSQTGVTLAIQNSAVQGAQTVQNMDQSMMKTKSARMKALGAASAVMVLISHTN